MKKITYLIFMALVALSACEAPKKPEIKDVRDVKVVSSSLDEMVVEAKVIVFNPNLVDLEVTGADISFTVNDIPASDVNQIVKTTIPAGKEEGVPMTATFSPNEIFKSGGNLLSMMFTKKAMVKYKGHITVKVMGVSLDVPLDEQKELDLNKKN